VTPRSTHVMHCRAALALAPGLETCDVRSASQAHINHGVHRDTALGIHSSSSGEVLALIQSRVHCTGDHLPGAIAPGVHATVLLLQRQMFRGMPQGTDRTAARPRRTRGRP